MIHGHHAAAYSGLSATSGRTVLAQTYSQPRHFGLAVVNMSGSSGRRVHSFKPLRGTHCCKHGSRIWKSGRVAPESDMHVAGHVPRFWKRRSRQIFWGRAASGEDK